VIDSIYFKQAEMLLRILPLIDKETAFALKGGTAINFFIRNLPRISVDIDLVYLPVDDRDVSLREISAALVRLSQGIESRIPATKVTARKSKDTGLMSGLFVQRQGTIVKIEPNLIIRGCVYPPLKKTIVPKAMELFETSFECRTLAEDEIYAGKICAALDRQHPRDLFDIMMLLQHGSFSAAMRKAFIVYLISHDRPMVELLNPNFVNIRPVFEKEFLGMTSEEVTCENLEAAREQLVSLIAGGLTTPERQFIISVKKGEAQWELLGLKGIELLPAVKWKLFNISRMDKKKLKAAISKLEKALAH
jgi:predicted nucleotidyltransferase component of viral defense system